MESNHKELEQLGDVNLDTISILTREPYEESTEAMFPMVKKIITKSLDMSSDKLGEGLSHFVNRLARVVKKIPESCGDFDVDSVSFSLSIDAHGKISLVGEIGAGFTSGIIIALKRRC